MKIINLFIFFVLFLFIEARKLKKTQIPTLKFSNLLNFEDLFFGKNDQFIKTNDFFDDDFLNFQNMAEKHIKSLSNHLTNDTLGLGII